MNSQIATFAAGCFWGVEASFLKLKGVIDTRVGYTGGHFPEPDYQLVCTGTSGHAEAVRIVFDADVISYNELLKEFWQMHDPTTPNRQGPDYGSQYRSAVFYHDVDQKATAEQTLSELQEMKKYDHMIVTEIVPAGEFYEAEEYHQRYYQKHNVNHCC
jgi:methionine-S-sulfoxide reductase